MSKLIISAVQFDAKYGKHEKNLDNAVNYIDIAFNKGSNCVLLHEMWTVGYQEKIDKESIDFTNKALNVLGGISKKYKGMIVAGSMLEENKNGFPFNTSFIIGPDGNVLSKYQKIHLFPLMDEDKKYSAGSELCVFDLFGMKAGVIICYDLRFPEEVRALVDIGIEILFVPGQWPLERKNHWLTLLKARAIENQIYIISANRSGQECDILFSGNSAIIDPQGEIQELIEDKAGIITYKVDFDKLKEIRKSNPFMDSKRKDLYKKWFLDIEN